VDSPDRRLAENDDEARSDRRDLTAAPLPFYGNGRSRRLDGADESRRRWK
jgi:hypothetical protein